jgi:signal transduction histidine kinase
VSVHRLRNPRILPETFGPPAINSGASTEYSAQNRLAKTSKPSTSAQDLGAVSDGLAHDLNNLLTVIIGASEALAGDLAGGSESQELALVSLRAAEDGAGLLQRLLTFARQETPETQAVDCSLALASVEGLVGRLISPDLDLDVLPAHYPLLCRCDPAALESALLNLCINARDAMPNGGVLTLRSDAIWVEGAQAGTAGLAGGSYVRFTVQDTGIGMSPETLRRAAEPYFTTKRDLGGMGLGLSSVDGFARQSGGALSLTSRKGHGTTAQLCLPRATVRSTVGRERRVAPTGVSGPPKNRMKPS